MYKLIIFTERRLTPLTHLAGNLAGAAMMLMILLIFGNMLARYMAGIGAMWLQELEWHLLAVTVMLGISYAMSHDDHVRVDIFSHHLHRIGRLWLDLITMLLIAIPVALLVLYYTWPFVELSYMQAERSPNAGGMSWRFIPKGLILIGFIFILIQALVRVLACTRRLLFHYHYRHRKPRVKPTLPSKQTNKTDACKTLSEERAAYQNYVHDNGVYLTPPQRSDHGT